MSNNVIITNFNRINSIPDPASIFTTSDWYFLNHISSSLMSFNHTEGRYNPLLASSWEVTDNEVIFNINENAKFSDGSQITAIDVAYTIKRLIIKKTSTHFPIWNLLIGCENLISLNDECSGIKVITSTRISFYLKNNVESFFLLMASPEGGVWHYRDIDIKTLDIAANKFSGPYIFNKGDSEIHSLHKNIYSFIHNNFPDSPERIDFYSKSGAELDVLFENKILDVYMEPVRPFNSKYLTDLGYKRSVSSFSTILYLSKIGNHHNKIDRAFYEKLWSLSSTEDLAPAENILPYGSLKGITNEAFLKALPLEKSNDEIRIAMLTPYFKPELKEMLEVVATSSNTPIRITPVAYKTWIELNGKLENDPSFDFVFTIYVASERYPSVQIRFLLEGRDAPVDLTELDKVDTNSNRKELISKIENWMIESQNVLPLFFTRTHIISKPNIDLGLQPISDAEIQLWRIKKINL